MSTIYVGFGTRGSRALRDEGAAPPTGRSRTRSSLCNTRANDSTVGAVLAADRSQTMKGSQKPKKTGKKPAQKTLKERRVEKRAAAKQTRSLDV